MKLKDVKNQVSKLRGMDVAALGDELTKLKREQFNLRFQQATGQLEKTSRMREVRRMIARTRTLMGQSSAKTTV